MEVMEDRGPSWKALLTFQEMLVDRSNTELKG